MKITRLDIKGYGRFRQQVFEPGPGLNLVHGPNEAGKSTLLSFVRAMLYGMRGGRRTREGGLPPLRRYEPWQGEVYAGILEYRLDDGSEYRVGRNFSKGTTQIQDSRSNDVTDRFPVDRETGPTFAEIHLGVDAETFAHTLHVGQMQIVLDGNGRRHLMDSLLQVQDAGREERSFRQAEDALQKALLERVGSDRSTVRPMDRILNQMETLAAEAEIVRKQREDVRETAFALMEANSRLTFLQKKQKVLVSECELFRIRIRSGELLVRMRARQDAEKRLQELDAAELAAQAEAGALSSRLAARSALSFVDAASAAQLPFDMGRLRELRRTCSQREEDFTRKTNEMDRLKAEFPVAAVWRDPNRPQERQINRVIVTVGFIALFLGAAGLVWTGHTDLGIALGVAAGLAALAVLMIPKTLHQKAMVDAIVKRLSDLEQDKTVISIQIAQAMAEAGRLADKAGSLLRTAGFPVGDIMDETRMREFQQVWQEYREDRNRIAQVNMTMESIAHEHEAVMRALSIPDDEEEEGIAGENEDAGVIEAEAASAAMALPGLLERLEQLGAEISTSQRTIATLETRLERVPTEDRLQWILEDMDRLDARRTTLQSYGESLHIALQVLRESALQLRQGISPRLDCLSGEIFSDMTKGRYRRIGTDDQLTVRVEVPEISEMPAIGQLSGGTAEQAWLAVRLAAVRLLEEGRETLPLFLDEPFAQFDEERTAASLEWLKRNAGNRQIFLFTCRNRDRELAESIFSGSVTRIALSPS